MKEQNTELWDIRAMFSQAGVALANGLHTTVRTLIERNNRDVADKLKELEDIRTALKKTAYMPDESTGIQPNVVNIVRGLAEYANATGLGQKHTATEEDHDSWWIGGRGLDVAVSIPLLRGLTAIIAEHTNDGPPTMIQRRHRIVRTYRALHALAATHGVELDQHMHDDL